MANQIAKHSLRTAKFYLTAVPIFACAALVLFCTSCGEVGSLDKPEPNADYMLDSIGNFLLMDFNIPLTSIEDTNTPFSELGQQPLMIYYFAPWCPHSKNGYGPVQSIAKEYEQRGLSSIAVSTGSVDKEDILEFMEQQNASIPFFQDYESTFGRKYGDGYVPRVFLVYLSGKVVRYISLSDESLTRMKADIERLLDFSETSSPTPH
jgi:thiol-disulfide isomerase/thioredoxin